MSIWAGGRNATCFSEDILLTIEEIFNKLSAHALEGIMLHNDFANYFAFVGLHGYEAMQSERFMDESESYSKLQKFYINTYSKILKQQPLQYESFIPTNIYGRSSQDVAANMVRQCVKSVAEKWVAWETETKELYEEMYIELMNHSEVQTALFISSIISDVTNELNFAKVFLANTQMSNYDIVYILEEQNIGR